MLKTFLRSIIILFTIFYNVATSNASEVNKQELLADIQYLLSSEPIIDYDDPKLNEILSSV